MFSNVFGGKKVLAYRMGCNSFPEFTEWLVRVRLGGNSILSAKEISQLGFSGLLEIRNCDRNYFAGQNFVNLLKRTRATWFYAYDGTLDGTREEAEAFMIAQQAKEKELGGFTVINADEQKLSSYNAWLTATCLSIIAKRGYQIEEPIEILEKK